MLPLINGTRTKTQCLVLDQVRKLVVNKELNIQLGEEVYIDRSLCWFFDACKRIYIYRWTHPAVVASDTGAEIYVKITNSKGTTTSNTATLDVR